MRSLLPIVAAADNFPPHAGVYPSAHPVTLEKYTPFHLCRADYEAGLVPVGLLRPAILLEFQAVLASSTSRPAFELAEKARIEPDGLPVHEVQAVFFAEWAIREDKMTEVMNGLARRWKDEGKFPGPLGGWRDEQYMLYTPSGSALRQASSSSKPLSNVAFTLERAACGLFGLPTFGVHMTAYEGEGKDMKIWVPRRSATKATWPSRLDNSVAGGIAAGMTPMETMIKECDEEASLPEDLVRRCVRPTGAVTYFYITDDGYLQPGKLAPCPSQVAADHAELEYTYDLKLPPRDDPSYVRPRPHDDEVESFALLSLSETIEALHSGEFKPNCGLILVDFLIRHGLVTPEDEPAYFEIVWRTKRRLGVAVPA